MTVKINGILESSKSLTTPAPPKIGGELSNIAPLLDKEGIKGWLGGRGVGSIPLPHLIHNHLLRPCIGRQ